LRSPPFERVAEGDGVLEERGEPEAPDEEPALLLGTVTTTVEVGPLVVLLWVTRVVAGVSEVAVVVVAVVSALAEPEVAVVVVVSGVPVVEGLEEEDSVAEEDLVSVAVVAVEDELEVEPV
jgi:hypothetical protein